ncbi:MAG: hypothetical protein HZA67_09715 [Rhodospirillales bacterium]|nr:hypothetical protein [Rhodospirillales bacterium]
MKIVYKFLTLLALLLSHNAYALDRGGSPASRQDAVKSEVACPATDFTKFLSAFANDTKVQHAFTKYPLKELQLDIDAEPEPKPIVRNLERHQIQFPVFPLQEERIKQLLKIRINNISARKANTTLFKPNTGYKVNYFFTKNTCWRLDRVEDWSM